jgi:molybdate/tungstate transport system substrate-binding protein
MRLIAFILFPLVLFYSCKNDVKRQSTLTIFHAGSLSFPMKTIADSFKAENPGIAINLEAAGSIECARKITELNRQCDIMVLADYRIIDQLLIPKYADWNILFAGNEMAIVYTKKSLYANEISQLNWFEILMRPNVHFGRSDPNADPCGYRALLTLQLAEKYYGKPSLAKDFEIKDNRFVRPKEVDLIALLETGAIDYIFLYRSVAVQHGFEFLSLPSEINLGNPNQANEYSLAHVKVRGSSLGDTLLIVGEPMVYGITIPQNAPNNALAENFLKYFLNPEKGLKIIKQMGMPPLNPLIIKNEDKIETSLKDCLFNIEYKTCTHER